MMTTKNKIVIFTLILFIVISVVSVGQGMRNSSAQNRIMRNMINSAYHELYIISLNLNDLLMGMENDNAAANLRVYSTLSRSFARLDTTLKWYAVSFPPKGIIRSSYHGMPDFSFISDTLTDGTGGFNNMQYSGILFDGKISEKEIRYLEILRDDIDVILASMVSSENPPQENQNLTIRQIDDILNAFFSKWSFHHEDSPYFLLVYE